MSVERFGRLELERSGGVLRLELKGADARSHAIDPTFLEELDAALAAVEAEGPGLLVITAAGRVFSTGVDLAAVDALPPAEAEAFFRRGRRLIGRVLGLEAITLAAVNGLALGGGFELALACDVRWGHARAAFGFPESRSGLVPGWGGLELLGRHLSRSRVLEMAASGSYLGAQAALEAGLVSRLFRGRDFDEQVREAFLELGSRPPEVLRAIKELCGARGRSEEAVAREAEVFSGLWSARGRASTLVAPAGAGPERPAGRASGSD